MKSLTTFIERKLKLKVNQVKSRVVPSKVVKFLGMTVIAGTLAISQTSLNRAMSKVKELIPRKQPTFLKSDHQEDQQLV